MFNNRCFEDEMNININMNDNNYDMNKNYDMNNYDMNGGYMNMSNMCDPIVEAPCERVCHREICHNVEHIQPVNTRIINHHIYHHTYRPCYTCCEENEVCNVYGPNPCSKM